MPHNSSSNSTIDTTLSFYHFLRPIIKLYRVTTHPWFRSVENLCSDVTSSRVHLSSLIKFLSDHQVYTLPCQIETPGVLLGLVVAYPPRFFDSDGFFLFLTPGVFIQTEVFLNWWLMLLYGPRFFGTEPEVFIQPVVPETCTVPPVFFIFPTIW